MLFKSVAAVAFLAATVVADGAAIVKSLQTVDKDIAALNNTLIPFNGNLLQTIPILAASTQLENDLKAGTKTAMKSANLTVDETIALLGPVNQLASDASITVNTLVAKEPQFQKLFLTGIIKLILQSAKQDAVDYSNAIIAKVPQALQSTAQTLVAPITTNFDRAIAAYS